MTVPSLLAAEKIRDIASKRGASACGIVRADAIAEHARFCAAAAGVPAGLAYLRRSPSLRSDIRNWFPPAKSVLVCAFQYWHSGLDYAAALKKIGGPSARLEKSGRSPHSSGGRNPWPEFTAGIDPDGRGASISRYALVPDYHEVIREKLGLILADIKAACPGTEGKPFTDTSPVLEKELGRQAGLGFRGKNTLLISKELGSYFFIGGLALSLDAGHGKSSVQDTEQGCGTCGKCAAACPTGALNVSGALDAGLCVSYWTTQSKTAAPEEIIRKSGGYVYGCDICQDVCPYNNKTPDRICLPEFRNNI
ncbi:MAG: QueG-associated DUF1730 domain-containing protein [Elusimicrobiota bacterium]